jgi:hypothetical protein
MNNVKASSMVRSGIFRIILLIIVMIWIIGIAIFLPEYLKFKRLVGCAHAEYEQSRGDGSLQTTSYKFITRGIEYGMSESEVDKLMAKALERCSHLHQSTPAWNGFVNTYRFEYGEKYHNPFFGRDDVLFIEYYDVYFDSEGHAVKISRDLFSRDYRYSGFEDIDLENGVIITRD